MSSVARPSVDGAASRRGTPSSPAIVSVMHSFPALVAAQDPSAAILVCGADSEITARITAGLELLGRRVVVVPDPRAARVLLDDPDFRVSAALVALQDPYAEVSAFFEVLQESHPRVRRIAYAQHGHPEQAGTDNCLHDMILWDSWDRESFADTLTEALDDTRGRLRSSWSDQELFARGGGTDDRSVAEIIRRYRHRITSLAKDATESREDAEDMTQEVHLAIVRDLPSYAGVADDCSPGRWIDRVAQRTTQRFSGNARRSLTVTLPTASRRPARPLPAGPEPSQTPPRSTRANENDGDRLRMTTYSDAMSVALVAAFAGDRSMTAADNEKLRVYLSRRGYRFFSDLLYVITHTYFAPEHAEPMWDRIQQHKADMSGMLGRNVGVTVAALDLLSNVQSRLTAPTLISESHAAEIADSSMRDGMTLLFNHTTCYELLELELKGRNHLGIGPALLLLDIDDFKAINDEHGHQAGDRIILQISRVLRAESRAVDICCRTGGDEFAVILPATNSRDAAERVARRITRSASELGLGGVRINMSVGVAVSSGHTVSALQLMEEADRALYAAKARSRTSIASPSPSVGGSHVPRRWISATSSAPACELCGSGDAPRVDPNCEDAVICKVCLRAGLHTYSFEDLGNG